MRLQYVTSSHYYKGYYVPAVVNVTITVDGLTEFEVDEEVGSDVMVVVNVSSEDTGELAGDLMVMVNISSGAADTASKCIMSKASVYLLTRMKLHTSAESGRSGTCSYTLGWGVGGGVESLPPEI